MLKTKKSIDETLKDDLDTHEFFSMKYNSINPTKIALKIAGIYTVTGCLWILLSDRLLGFFVKDIERLQLLQTYKGWLYIIVTGILVLYMVKGSLSETQGVSNKLYRSYEELNLAYEELIATEEDLQNRFDELKESQEALAESEKRYQLIFEGVKDGIWDWDINNNNVHISQRCIAMLGYEECECDYDIETWQELLHPEDKVKALKAINDYLNKETGSYSDVFRLKAENGEYNWVQVRGQAIWNDDGKPIRMAGSLTDITDQKKYAERILNLAYYDLITKLPNRAMFEKELDSKILWAKKNNIKLALLYFDLDDFKNVNDTLGHTYGDKLLKMIASEFLKYKKKDNVLARLGGDEFALIISDVKDIDEIHNIAKTIIKSLNRPWILNSQEFYISTSIGIAFFPEHGNDYQSLLKNADTAMYCAKEKGKRTYEIYKKEMYMKAIRLVDMEKSLRHALKNSEFILNYQTMVDMKKDEIIGAEALIRWQHPERGLISPANFIPLAEKTGIIKEIGKWAIRTACMQNRIWLDKGYKAIKLSVNMSAQEFKQENLVENIKNTLKEIEIDSKYIVFEITENTALEDLNHTIEVLNQLKEMGMQIALDDFGTGYSSLNYLKKLPIDYLKLDKSFIKDVNIKSKDQAITKSLIDLAHEIGLKVVAEGIETEEQYKYLKEINCDIGQGYYFNKPEPTKEFEKLLG